jgi:hypothetical protein
MINFDKNQHNRFQHSILPYTSHPPLSLMLCENVQHSTNITIRITKTSFYLKKLKVPI